MSGGSFNYLLNQFEGDLVEHRGDVAAMADSLDSNFPGSLAAQDTADLAADINNFVTDIEARAARLRDVWHAVEWWQSCDYSRDQALAAVEAYSIAEVADKGGLLAEIRKLCADDALQAAHGGLLAHRIARLLRDWEGDQ